MRVLYFDCFSGASGDMILGALLDAGAREARVREALGRLGLPGWELEIASTDRGGFRATSTRFHIERTDLSRTYPDVLALLHGSSLAPETKERALRVFSLLAEAEGRVHGVSRDRAHFHEVGADDAILDVVASLTALEDLGPERVVTSPIATGTAGLASTSHGLIPVPAPATAELLSSAGAALFGRGSEELITPTGAALLAQVSDSFGDLPSLRLEKVGYGAGSKALDHPNLLRILVGESVPSRADTVLLETNLDDLSPELLPDVVEALLGAGAHDAWITPVVMKKGRAGFVLSVLGPRDRRDALLEIIFTETSTLGVRFMPVAREILDREWVEVKVEGHPVRVKLGRRAGRITTVAPEHDDAAQVARSSGLPLKMVYRKAVEALDGGEVAPSAEPTQT